MINNIYKNESYVNYLKIFPFPYIELTNLINEKHEILD